MEWWVVLCGAPIAAVGLWKAVGLLRAKQPSEGFFDWVGRVNNERQQRREDFVKSRWWYRERE